MQAAGFARRFDDHQLGDVALELASTKAQNYRSATPFDLIHFTHSILHIAGQEEAVLRDAVRMLRPYGQLVIAIGMEEGGMYRAMRQFWEVIDYGAFGDGLFGQTKLRNMLKRNQLPFTYALFPDVHIDVTSCFDPHSTTGQHLLNFIFQADLQQVPPTVQQQARTFLADISARHGERTILYHGSGVFGVSLPTPALDNER